MRLTFVLFSCQVFGKGGPGAMLSVHFSKDTLPAEVLVVLRFTRRSTSSPLISEHSTEGVWCAAACVCVDARSAVECQHAEGSGVTIVRVPPPRRPPTHCHVLNRPRRR